MDKNAQRELSPGAFQVWMGQWRLATLDTEGCMFVLRFLLRAFRSRRSEDDFWKFLEQFLFAEDDGEEVPAFERVQTTRQLLAHAGALSPDQARALVAYLGQCYATDGDRFFWSTISEAIQLYAVAPYTGRSAGTA